MELNELNEMIRFLYERNLPIHIDTFDGFFYNGLILSFTDKLIVVDEIKMGETPIAISKIKSAERYRGRW